MIHDVIDEFVISIHPVVLGDGIPLFRGPIPMAMLKLQNAQSFDTGLVQLTYVRRST
jgi:dihydrofolate reductase